MKIQKTWQKRKSINNKTRPDRKHIYPRKLAMKLYCQDTSFIFRPSFPRTKFRRLLWNDIFKFSE